MIIIAEITWIKLNIDMFDNRKIKQIRNLPGGNDIVLFWVMLLTSAGRSNSQGYILLTDRIPYTPEMLATEFHMSLDTVKMALAAFEKFNMIEIEEQAIKVKNWDEYQSVEGMEKVKEQTRRRVAKYRENKKLLKQGNATSNATVTQSNGTESDTDTDIDSDIRCCSCNAISKEEYVNKAVNYYCTKAGILDANFKTTDIAALMEIYQDGLPFEIVIKGIDDAFKSFKPKYKDDKINSFKFCVPIIRSLHEREKAKEVDNNAETGGDTQSKSGEMSDEARKFYSRGLD